MSLLKNLATVFSLGEYETHVRIFMRIYTSLIVREKGGGYVHIRSIALDHRQRERERERGGQEEIGDSRCPTFSRCN